MVDYANMPIYQHGLRATEPTTGQEVAGVLDPNKRYNLEFTSQQIPASQVSPTDLAGAISQEQRFPIVNEDMDVGDRAELDYKAGSLNAQNQYLEDMLIIDKIPPNLQQHTLLSATAAIRFQSEMGKLETKKQKWDNVQRTLRQNPQYDNPMIRGLEEDYYSKNPIYKISSKGLPTIEKPPPALFTPAHVQTTLGELATTTDFDSVQGAVNYAAGRLGKDFATNYPEAVQIIAERAKTNFEPLDLAPTLKEPPPPVAPPSEPESAWQKIKRFWGGGEKAQPAPTGTPYEQYRTEAQRLGATQIATPQEYEAMQTKKQAATAPTTERPLGYPDAVFNPQYGMWTVIKKGKIVGLKTK